MKCLRQQIETFENSNISQLYDDYNATTTYIFESDDQNLTNSSVVRYGNYYYRSLVNDNIGFNPEEYNATNPSNDKAKWVKWGVSNKFSMLDTSSTTVSKNINNDIVVEFQRNLIDTLVLGQLTTSNITIEHYDSDDTLLDNHTQVIEFGASDEVVDLWSYIYKPYSMTINRSIKIDLPPIGYKIKVTISEHPILNYSSCGFLVGGESLNMGCTSFDIDFNYQSYSSTDTDKFGTTTIIKRNIQDLVDFETTIESSSLKKVEREIKDIYDEIVVFILEDRDGASAKYENLITFGKIENVNKVLVSDNDTVISWSIFESL
jgi:hypothetical protein